MGRSSICLCIHPSIQGRWKSEVQLKGSKGQPEGSGCQLEESEDQLVGSKGLPEESEVLPEEYKVLSEGLPGACQKELDLPEGAVGLPEEPEG